MEIVKLIQSALGVAFIVFLVWKLFPKPSPLTIERVRENFMRCYPDQIIHNIYMDTEGKTAFVKLSDMSAFGVARTLGDRMVCRSFHVKELDDLHTIDNDITLRLNDFTLPKIKLTLLPDEVTQIEKVLSFNKKQTISHAN